MAKESDKYDTRHLDENYIYDGSGMATRSCTDLPCLVLFVAFLLSMCSISIYAFQTGEPRRLTHSFNYNGELCGVDTAVDAKPFVYWCRAGEDTDSGHPSKLDFASPICVVSCPSDFNSEMICLGKSEMKVSNIGTAPLLTKETIITQTTVKQRSYPTMEFGGAYCVPHFDKSKGYLGDDPLVQELIGQYGPLGNGYFRMAAAFGSLRRSWRTVLGCSCVSVLLSYVYLFLLKFAPYPTSIVSLTLTMTATFAMSVYFLLGEFLHGDWMESYKNGNSYYHLFSAQYAAWLSKVTGLLLLGTFCFLACAFGYMRRCIITAAGCVKVAVECVFSMPTMLLTPLLEAATKLTLWFCLLAGLTYLLATGSVQMNTVEAQKGTLVSVKGKLVFSNEQQWMLAFYAIGTLWLLELSRSLSAFVVSYAVILWYYTPKPKDYGPSFPLMRGFIIGSFFHLGSIAFGSLAIAVVRPFRIAFMFLSRQAKDGGNPICGLLATCFSSCIGCAQRYMEFVTKNAYIDVVISSTPFLTAAQNAHGFISADTGKVAQLSGAFWVINLAVVSGVFTITVITLVIIYLLTDSPLKDSQHKIENPYFVVVMGGILSASLSAAFIVVLEHCSDTLMYAFLWNKSHGHNTVAKYCPDNLAALMEYKKATGKASQRPDQPGIFSAFGTFFQTEMPKEKGKSPEEVALLSTK